MMIASHSLKMIEIGSGLQPLRVDNFFQSSRRHVADVRLARIDLFGLCLVNFKAGASETLARKLHKQRQTHIAQANDADVGLFVGY